MAQKPVLRGEVGCACVAREVSVERGGMGERILMAYSWQLMAGSSISINSRGLAQKHEKILAKEVRELFNGEFLLISGSGPKARDSIAILPATVAGTVPVVLEGGGGEVLLALLHRQQLALDRVPDHDAPHANGLQSANMHARREIKGLEKNVQVQL